MSLRDASINALVRITLRSKLLTRFAVNRILASSDETQAEIWRRARKAQPSKVLERDPAACLMAERLDERALLQRDG
jgi:hypothetical protein